MTTTINKDMKTNVIENLKSDEYMDTHCSGCNKMCVITDMFDWEHAMYYELFCENCDLSNRTIWERVKQEEENMYMENEDTEHQKYDKTYKESRSFRDDFVWDFLLN